AEIGLRRGSARGAYRCETSAITHHDRVGRIEPRGQRLRDVGNAAALTQTIEGPASFTEAVDETCLGQQLEMARDARLRLAQDLGEVGDRKVGFGEQRENAQARAFARGPE